MKGNDTSDRFLAFGAGVLLMMKEIPKKLISKGCATERRYLSAYGGSPWLVSPEAHPLRDPLDPSTTPADCADAVWSWRLPGPPVASALTASHAQLRDWRLTESSLVKVATRSASEAARPPPSSGR